MGLINLVISLLLFNGAWSQNLCTFSNDTKTLTESSGFFIENLSAGKCLRVENFGHFSGVKVLLDECSWWEERITGKDQVFTLNNSSLASGKLIRSGASESDDPLCLTTDKSSLLANANCAKTSFDQIWTVRNVTALGTTTKRQPNGLTTTVGQRQGQFLIQQSSSSKCLVPSSRKNRATVTLSPCNSLMTEQLWRICSK